MKAKYELWNKYVSPETRKNQVITQLKGESTIVINAVTKEEQYFISGREAAKFIGVQQSTISSHIRKNKFYLGKGFLVYKSSIRLDEITNSEAYKEAVYKFENQGVKIYSLRCS